MLRLRAGKLLRTFVATFALLANFGPQDVYAHAHPMGDGGRHETHHDHAGSHTDGHSHQSSHDARPGLTDALAHAHGWWFGLETTSRLGDQGSGQSGGRVEAAPASKAAGATLSVGLELRTTSVVAYAPIAFTLGWGGPSPSRRRGRPRFGGSPPLCDAARHARSGVLLT
ncbi:MAG: hypothetical protein BGO49_26245 [Planctomycetales bacterium 71-10]|nr:MAG: hypothetical protein BGO49_26245 [Planctomycetales bacterium 71-10]